MKASIDILIVGGGIHGAGIAQASAASGYSTLVLEQTALASGTSSKSSKLIHGGLRYLETAKFSLVRECLQEREYLLANAPHLVELKPFYFPIYAHTTRRPLQIRLGLSLYALLSGLKQTGLFKSLPAASWSKLDGLSTKDLQAVFQYFDAQTDDKLLTQAVMRSAQDLGAEVVVPGQFQGARREGGKWLVSANQNLEIETSIIINAAGPWANLVLDKVVPKPKTLAVDLVKGSHILLDGETAQGIYYLEVRKDKRAVFVMPWKGSTLVGTTEKEFVGDPSNVSASEEEIMYLLDVVKDYFPKYKNLPPANVKDSFAGLRVLPASDKNPFFRSRETIFFEDKNAAPGVLTVYGGKLTSYRATAEALIKKIRPHLPARKVIADTRTLKLPQ